MSNIGWKEMSIFIVRNGFFRWNIRQKSHLWSTDTSGSVLRFSRRGSVPKFHTSRTVILGYRICTYTHMCVPLFHTSLYEPRFSRSNSALLPRISFNSVCLFVRWGDATRPQKMSIINHYFKYPILNVLLFSKPSTF